MSAVVKQLREMSLGARATEFQRVLTSMEVADGSGGPQDTEDAKSSLVEWLEELRTRGGGLNLVGNGGKAGIANHAVTDFLKFGKLRATTLHDPSLLSA